MFSAMPSSFRLLVQVVLCAWSLALAKAGNSIAARIAMMAITTKSSISVNPSDRFPVRPAAEADIPFMGF
jgi:hypothetical protein